MFSSSQIKTRLILILLFKKKNCLFWCSSRSSSIY